VECKVGVLLMIEKAEFKYVIFTSHFVVCHNVIVYVEYLNMHKITCQVKRYAQG